MASIDFLYNLCKNYIPKALYKMSTKELAVNTAKAIAWDQAFGYLDRLIFYPLLWFLALHYGYFVCFLVATPCYFLFSSIIVWMHYRAMYERNEDLFGMHFMQEAAHKTRPPKFGKNIILYPCHQLKFLVISLWQKQFRISGHIIQRAYARIQMKIQSWLLNNKWLLYTAGTLHVFDPSSVFMFTQKCLNEDELAVSAVKKLLPLVVWHIAYWSLIFWGATKGYSWIVQP